MSVAEARASWRLVVCFAAKALSLSEGACVEASRGALPVVGLVALAAVMPVHGSESAFARVRGGRWSRRSAAVSARAAGRVYARQSAEIRHVIVLTSNVLRSSLPAMICRGRESFDGA